MRAERSWVTWGLIFTVEGYLLTKLGITQHLPKAVFGVPRAWIWHSTSAPHPECLAPGQTSVTVEYSWWWMGRALLEQFSTSVSGI